MSCRDHCLLIALCVLFKVMFVCLLACLLLFVLICGVRMTTSKVLMRLRKTSELGGGGEVKDKGFRNVWV